MGCGFLCLYVNLPSGVKRGCLGNPRTVWENSWGKNTYIEMVDVPLPCLILGRYILMYIYIYYDTHIMKQLHTS